MVDTADAPASTPLFSASSSLFSSYLVSISCHPLILLFIIWDSECKERRSSMSVNPTFYFYSSYYQKQDSNLLGGKANF